MDNERLAAVSSQKTSALTTPARTDVFTAMPTRLLPRHLQIIRELLLIRIMTQ